MVRQYVPIHLEQPLVKPLLLLDGIKLINEGARTTCSKKDYCISKELNVLKKLLSVDVR